MGNNIDEGFEGVRMFNFVNELGVMFLDVLNGCEFERFENLEDLLR